MAWTFLLMLWSVNGPGVELVGFPKKEANLKVSTGSNMLRGFSSFPQPLVGYRSDSDWENPVIRQRKPLEVRNSRRERAVALRRKAARHHAEVALCKYNRANNTEVFLSLSLEVRCDNWDVIILCWCSSPILVIMCPLCCDFRLAFIQFNRAL